VACLDDLGTELFVIRDIQFLFVVKKPIDFFPLKKVVNQSVRAFPVEYFEGLSNFDFAIGAISNLLFKFQRFGKSSSGKRDKVK
jgi:hypothetical protein